jgi:regulator of sigma E protease
MYILNFLLILLEVLLLFNLLIFVHELGHFLAAKWRGLKIERFAVWFGKPIWQKEINGVVYCLGSIPAGGYVALPQMASMEAIEGKTETKQEQLPPISALDKIIVAFAGPLFSLLLAFVFASIVWAIGRPVGESETKTVIGYVYTNSPAEKAGLLAGDEIKKVDGKTVSRFSGIGETVMWRIVSSEGDIVPITVLRNGKEMTFDTHPVKEKTQAWERKSLREIQILPLQTPIVARIYKDSPAAKAGIQANDVIIEANGVHLFHPQTLIDIVRTNANKPIVLKVQRGKSKELELSVVPAVAEVVSDIKSKQPPEKHAAIGITDWEMGGKMDIDHPDPISQVRSSVTAMVGTLGALLSPKSDVKLQHLSGPVGIMRIYWRLFESDYGWRLAIWFSVVLNVNLALLNMLPIPVLDGGHILLALIEGVRRRPVNVRILNWIQTGCAVVIIGYMLYVTFFDAQDLSFRRQRKPEFKFVTSPPEASNPKQ